MKNKLLTFLLILSLSLISSITVFASTYVEEPKAAIEINLNSIDLSKPFAKTIEYKTENGDLAILEMNFTPNPNYNPNVKGKDAVAGTWSTTSNYVLFGLSYDFDLTKSGSEWKISNARNLNASGPFCTFADKQLVINRATSTPTFAAEIAASADVTLFDNQWVNIGTAHPIVLTTVYKGVVTSEAR